jgi:hypothetical protein
MGLDCKFESLVLHRLVRRVRFAVFWREQDRCNTVGIDGLSEIVDGAYGTPAHGRNVRGALAGHQCFCAAPDESV